MDRSSAPGVFRLACSRTGFAPASSGTWVLPSVRPSADNSTSAGPALGAETVTSMGNCSPVNAMRRQADGFQAQRRLRPARQREGIDGNPELLRLPGRARDAALVLLAVGDQRDARHHARGQRRDGFANGGFEIGGAAGFAGGRLQAPGLLVFARCRARAWSGRTESRASSGVPARPALRAPAAMRAPDPSAKCWPRCPPEPPRATLVSLTLKRGSASASRIATSDSALSTRPAPRRAPPFPDHPGQRKPGDRQNPGAIEGHDAFLQAGLRRHASARRLPGSQAEHPAAPEQQPIEQAVPRPPSTASHGQRSVRGDACSGRRAESRAGRSAGGCQIASPTSGKRQRVHRLAVARQHAHRARSARKRIAACFLPS